MVAIDKAVTARITRDKQTFEILVDSEKALEFRKGKPISIENVLAFAEVFKDARKGERAGAKEIGHAFGTLDIFQVAAQIVRLGDLQLTTEQRRKMADEKWTAVANLIARRAVNPQTKLPHPPQRIMNAMEEAHISLDPFKPAEDQVPAVVEKLRPIIQI